MSRGDASKPITDTVANAGDHPMPRRAKEEMRRESPDGMPPQQPKRGLSRVILITGITLASIVAIIAAFTFADTEAGLLAVLGVVLLVGLIGGLPAIFAGILRKKERRRAEMRSGNMPSQ